MDLLETLRRFLATRSARVYLVGGAVRDRLLGRPTHDLDLSVDGQASTLARALADSIGASFYVMDEQFDVARVIVTNDGERDVVDFARLRGGSLEEDLGSRDFTLNALAAEARTWDGAAEGVIDPFGGLEDLAAHRLRAVTPFVFANDPVRLVRAVRMEAELGVALDEPTAALARRDAGLLANAPGERLRDEFVRILGAVNVLRQLRRLDELGLLDALLPELVSLRATTQSAPHSYPVLEHSLYAVAAAEEAERSGYLNLAQGAFGGQLRAHFAQATSGGRTRRELLRLTLLLHDIGKPATRSIQPDGRIRFLNHEAVGAGMVEPILRRLRFSDKEITHVQTMVANHLRPILLAQSGGVSDRAVHRFFRDTGDAGVDVAVHAWCDQRATYGDALLPDVDAALQGVIGRLLDRYYHARAQVVSPPLLLNGTEIMRHLNLAAGPRIGMLLDALREAQAAGQVRTREQALDWVKHFDTSG